MELGGGMYSISKGQVPAGTGITDWYQLVPRNIYVRVYIVCIGTGFTVYVYEKKGYVQAPVPEVHV